VHVVKGSVATVTERLVRRPL